MPQRFAFLSWTPIALWPVALFVHRMRLLVQMRSRVASVLSTTHLASVLRMYGLRPVQRATPWHTPVLPLLLVFSSLWGAVALLFVSWHTGQAFGKEMDMPALAGLARVLAALLLSVALRIADLKWRGLVHRSTDLTREQACWGWSLLRSCCWHCNYSAFACAPTADGGRPAPP